jgi:hypothetical protein
MRLLHLIRLITVVTAVAYPLALMPTDWLEWLHDRLEHASVIYETGHSAFIAAGVTGVYITAFVAVLLSFFTIPRFSWGASALSWCFLIMGLCLLTRLEMGYWDRYLSVTIQLIGYAYPLCFALPPLVIGSLLRYSFVRQRLYHDESSGIEPSNQAMERTADRRTLHF